MENVTEKVPKKRQRSENWLEEDKRLLTELVRERVSVIENKNTDTNTNTKKLAAWTDLLNSFNNMCQGGKRTLAQLKSQWGIIKMNQKKLKSIERKQITATGGGPPPQRDPENADDISAWLPNEFIIDSNEFDSDQINQMKIGEQSADIIKLDDTEALILEIHHQEDENTQEVASGSKYIEEEVKNDKTKQNGNKVVPPTNERKRKLMKNGKNENKVTTHAATIASVETECRQELHSIQMENEKRKARNLDLEEILLKKKIEYYEKKINSF